MDILQPPSDYSPLVVLLLQNAERRMNRHFDLYTGKIQTTESVDFCLMLYGHLSRCRGGSIHNPNEHIRSRIRVLHTCKGAILRALRDNRPLPKRFTLGLVSNSRFQIQLVLETYSETVPPPEKVQSCIELYGQICEYHNVLHICQRDEFRLIRKKFRKLYRINLPPLPFSELDC